MIMQMAAAASRSSSRSVSSPVEHASEHEPHPWPSTARSAAAIHLREHGFGTEIEDDDALLASAGIAAECVHDRSRITATPDPAAGVPCSRASHDHPGQNTSCSASCSAAMGSRSSSTTGAETCVRVWPWPALAGDSSAALSRSIARAEDTCSCTAADAPLAVDLGRVPRPAPASDIVREAEAPDPASKPATAGASAAHGAAAVTARTHVPGQPAAAVPQSSSFRASGTTARRFLQLFAVARRLGLDRDMDPALFGGTPRAPADCEFEGARRVSFAEGRPTICFSDRDGAADGAAPDRDRDCEEALEPREGSPSSLDAPDIDGKSCAVGLEDRSIHGRRSRGRSRVNFSLSVRTTLLLSYALFVGGGIALVWGTTFYFQARNVAELADRIMSVMIFRVKGYIGEKMIGPAMHSLQDVLLNYKFSCFSEEDALKMLRRLYFEMSTHPIFVSLYLGLDRFFGVRRDVDAKGAGELYYLLPGDDPTVRDSYSIDPHTQLPGTLLSRQTGYYTTRREWFKQISTGKPDEAKWTTVYLSSAFAVTRNRFITLGAPLFGYTENASRSDPAVPPGLHGVLAIDLELRVITAFLRKTTGELLTQRTLAFVTDTHGVMIGISSLQCGRKGMNPCTFKEEAEEEALLTGPDGEAIYAQDNSNEVVRAVWLNTRSETSGNAYVTTEGTALVSLLQIGGERYFVAQAHIVNSNEQNLNWELFIAVPEGDLLMNVQRSNLINGIINATFLLFSLVFSLLIAFYITRPLVRLQETMRFITRAMSEDPAASNLHDYEFDEAERKNLHHAECNETTLASYTPRSSLNCTSRSPFDVESQRHETSEVSDVGGSVRSETRIRAADEIDDIHVRHSYTHKPVGNCKGPSTSDEGVLERPVNGVPLFTRTLVAPHDAVAGQEANAAAAPKEDPVVSCSDNDAEEPRLHPTATAMPRRSYTGGDRSKSRASSLPMLERINSGALAEAPPPNFANHQTVRRGSFSSAREGTSCSGSETDAGAAGVLSWKPRQPQTVRSRSISRGPLGSSPQRAAPDPAAAVEQRRRSRTRGLLSNAEASSMSMSGWKAKMKIQSAPQLARARSNSDTAQYQRRKASTGARTEPGLSGSASAGVLNANLPPQSDKAEKDVELISNSSSADLSLLAMPGSRLTEIQTLQKTFQALSKSVLSFSAFSVSNETFNSSSRVKSSIDPSRAVKFVPTGVVRNLLASNDHARLGMEIRPLTVMFVDIENFTRISERMSLQQLVVLVTEYFEATATVMEEHGATIDKYIGDAMMLIFNAPMRMADHEAQACAAALACKKRIADLRQYFRSIGLPALQSRFGVHTGDCLVGNLGTRSRMNYTAMGDSVNLASRCESLNKVYGSSILITGSVYEKVRQRFICRWLDRVVVKGKSEPTNVYELLCAVGDEHPAGRLLMYQDYAAALQNLLGQRFQEAAEAFEAILRRFPRDKPSQVMLERARKYLAEPTAFREAYECPDK